ncbi:hypothetical protein GCM10020367_23530 [Streptomyces sannanensis]|uniref:Uncharacterized protein n=1 Tax=Streptomyces sannanensis TaxID=285536 RepID=A0ABP6S9S7_9ACTN
MDEIVGAIVHAVFRGVAWLTMDVIGDVLLEGLVKAVKRAFRALRTRRQCRSKPRRVGAQQVADSADLASNGIVRDRRDLVSSM